MSSVQYSGNKYESMWQIQAMTMNDFMKQSGIHCNNLVYTFVLWQMGGLIFPLLSLSFI